RLDLRLGVDEELMLKLRRAQDQVSQSSGRPASLEDTLKEAICFYLHHKDPLERAKRVIAKKGTRAAAGEAHKHARTEAAELARTASAEHARTEAAAHARSETVNKLFTGTVRAPDPSSSPVRALGPSSSPVRAPKPANPNPRAPIPAATEHEVRLRDQNQCQAPKPGGGICGQRRWIDLHHLKPVSQGGDNTARNLVTLCRAHHRVAHAPPDKA